MAYTHEQVPVGVGDFTVDAGMADLITALWALGIETTNCCQGTDENWRSAYVAMPAPSFTRFLDLFDDEIEIARTARAMDLKCSSGHSEGEPDGHGPLIDGWHSNMRESFDTSTYHDGSSWVVNVALRFPPSFVPALTEIVSRRIASVA